MGDFMRLDSFSFGTIRKDYDRLDTMREKVIAESRSVIKLSKRVIYSIHRKDNLQARKHMALIKEAVKRLKSAAREPELKYAGIVRAALQEYVEAAGLYELLAKGTLPTVKKLGVDNESYLMGLCDLTGELGRSAVKAATDKDMKRFDEIKDFVLQLQGQLIQFDFRNGELRRKYDSVKYTVKKLEDMAFDLRDA